MSTKIVNGEIVTLSAEDVAERAADEAAWELVKAERETQATRATTRTALRTQWDSLPAWINGPYRPLFDAANRLLDEGSDEAAFEMIDAVEPTAKIAADPEKSAIFAAVKAQLAAAIQSLNP